MDITNDTSQELKIKKDSDEDDTVQKCMGGFGRYQWLLVLLFVPCKIPTALHPLGIVFLAPPVKYICNDNVSDETGDNWNKCPCKNITYTDNTFEDTIITTWNLICENEWLVSLSQTIFMLGLLFGSIIFGALSDRYGRKYSLISCVVLELGAGIGSSFAADYWTFVVLRFFIGATIGGLYIITFVLLMEFTGKQYRELASSAIQIPFNIGYVLLPILGYYFRKWQYLQFLYSISAVGLIAVYWFLPESPRWLLTAGRTEEAIAVIKRAANMNKRPTDKIADDVKKYRLEKLKQMELPKGTILDLFKTPNIRKNMICMAINWIVCSFGFFGVSQYIGQLSGNIFFNISLSAILNVLATVIIYYMAKYMKRKTSLLILNIGTTVCLFAIAIIPESGAIVKVVLACIGNLGMFVTFIVVYLYAAELFPTVIRNVAMGMASMASRFGSMAAPFVVTLESTALWLPPVLFGIAPLIAAILLLIMPETKGCNMMDTLEEGENFGMESKTTNQPIVLNHDRKICNAELLIASN